MPYIRMHWPYVVISHYDGNKLENKASTTAVST